MTRPRDINTFLARQRAKRAARKRKNVWRPFWCDQIEALDAALDGAPAAIAKFNAMFPGNPTEDA